MTTDKKKDPPKVAISIRLRKETLETFRRTGDGWQTFVSAYLDRLAESLAGRTHRRPR